jgi:type VI secretion system secreted protein Hcp
MQPRTGVCIVAIALVGGLGNTAAVADEMFLKFPGSDILGDSTDPQHRNEIALLSFNLEVDAESSWTHGGGANVGKPNPGKMNWENYFDTSSPVILGYILTGRSAPSATLTVRTDAQGNKAGFEYEKKTFTDVLFTGVGQSLSGAGRVVSKVSFVYKTLKVQTFAPGNPTALSCVSWDVVAETVTDCR